MTTTVHLLTGSSETEVVSSLKAYSSEGVPPLNVASKIEFPKPLHSTLQSYKLEEAKMAQTARLQKMAHPSRSAYSSVPI